MSASTDQDAIISEIIVAAAPEQVFRALVDPAQVPQWWGQPGTYRCQKFNSDLRVGGHWGSFGVGPDGGNFQVTGEYLEVDHLLACWCTRGSRVGLARRRPSFVGS